MLDKKSLMKKRDCESLNMIQVLQMRHLIDKPVEYLVKFIDKRNKRIKEIWKTEKDLLEGSLGRILLKRFQETKVGERGIDLYIGKRRSLNAKIVEQNKINEENNKKLEFENGETLNSGDDSTSNKFIGKKRKMETVSMKMKKKRKKITSEEQKNNDEPKYILANKIIKKPAKMNKIISVQNKNNNKEKNKTESWPNKNNDKIIKYKLINNNYTNNIKKTNNIIIRNNNKNYNDNNNKNSDNNKKTNTDNNNKNNSNNKTNNNIVNDTNNKNSIVTNDGISAKVPTERSIPRAHNDSSNPCQCCVSFHFKFIHNNNLQQNHHHLITNDNNDKNKINNNNDNNSKINNINTNNRICNNNKINIDNNDNNNNSNNNNNNNNELIDNNNANNIRHNHTKNAKTHPHTSTQELVTHRNNKHHNNIARRASVRQIENTLHGNDIVVRKLGNMAQVVLSSEPSINQSLQNSLDPKTFNQLMTVMLNLVHDECKVVLFSGSGSIFTSGIDLTYLLTSENDRKSAAKTMANCLRDFAKLLINFPKPLVAVVNGAAIGLGVAMLPLCDMVYASDKASFFCPYTTLGQPPEACSSYTFPRFMGTIMANEMLLRGRKITALEACHMGLVGQVVWPENLMNEVMARVKLMAQQSSDVLVSTKSLIRGEKRIKLESIVEKECQLLEDTWCKPETQRCISAFLNEYLESL